MSTAKKRKTIEEECEDILEEKLNNKLFKKKNRPNATGKSELLAISADERKLKVQSEVRQSKDGSKKPSLQHSNTVTSTKRRFGGHVKNRPGAKEAYLETSKESRE